MGRWTQYDEDSYRLPEGMKRVGYDADTGKYFFRDQDGSLWEGPEGAEFGEMRRVGNAPSIVANDPPDEDIEAAPSRADGYQPVASQEQPQVPRLSVQTNASAYRTIFPFFLLIAVVLLLVFRLVRSPASISPPEVMLCPGHSDVYIIKPGDTCWAYTRSRHCTLEDLKNVNPTLECNNLVPGKTLCLPLERPSVTAR